MGMCLSSSSTSNASAATSGTLPRDNSGKVDLLKLLPPAKDPRLPCLLLSGGVPDASQEAFADKPIEKKGPRGFESLGQKVGVACKKGLKAVATPNQDNFLILQSGSTAFYGVFDGHGEHGHTISSFAAPTIVQNLACDPQFKSDPASAMRSAFDKVQKECIARSQRKKVDCKQSGTTATLLVDRQLSRGTRELCVAHCGDSRAVLGYWTGEQGEKMSAMDLTIDHKPGMDGERERIVAAGGIVRRNRGDPNDRVFLRNALGPGLAMSRSIGDTIAASVGVISEPDVSVMKVQVGWRFVLICSDGVWEFISSQEAVELVAKFPPAEVQRAAEELAEEARQRWLYEEQNAVDDITVLCLWLV